MNTYLTGCDVLGASVSPLVDCVERGRSFAETGDPFADLLGAVHLNPFSFFQRTRSISDVITTPRMVITLYKELGRSNTYNKGITKAVVSGGIRHDRYLDPDTVMYEHPTTVTLYFDNAKPTTFKGLQTFTASGGKKAFDVIAGDFDVLGDLADYSYGEKQVQQLVQYFNALGRPSEFEPAVEAIYASYEDTRTSFATLAAWVRDDKMKQIGADASALMAKIQAAMAAKAAATGKPAPVVPSGPSSPVYTPKPNESWWDKLNMPVWTWVVGGVAVASLLGFAAYKIAFAAAPAAVPFMLGGRR